MEKCLERAETLLERESSPSAETAKAIKELVETAIAIKDMTRWGE